MKNSFHFFILGLAAEFAYPVDFVGTLLTTLFLHATRLLFLEAIFGLTPQLAGWSHSDVMVTFVFTILLSSVVDTSTPSIRTFVSYAHSGRLEPYLVQPVNVRLLMFGRWMRPGSLIVFVCLLPIAAFAFHQLHIQSSFTQWVACILALVMSVIIIVLTMATWSLTAFVTQRVLPTEYILRQIMRLNQIPPTLFDNRVLLGFILFLPVVLTSTVPAMILARNEFHLLVPLVGSLCLVYLGFTWVFHHALKRFNGMGG